MSSALSADDSDDDRRRGRKKRMLARALLVALILSVLLIFTPIRCGLPRTITVLLEPGFTGAYRVVVDERCPDNLRRSAIDYSVQMPASGVTFIEDGVFHRARARVKYANASTNLPEIVRVDGATVGASLPFPYLNNNSRWVLVGFVGTPAQFAEIGGYNGLQSKIGPAVIPPCP